MKVERYFKYVCYLIADVRFVQLSVMIVVPHIHIHSAAQSCHCLLNKPKSRLTMGFKSVNCLSSMFHESTRGGGTSPPYCTCVWEIYMIATVRLKFFRKRINLPHQWT